MKTTAIILLLLFYSIGARSQEMTAEQTKKDLLFLKEQIQQYNPALNNYNPDFDKQSSELIDKVTSSCSLFQYFRKISQLCALSNEGHFGLGTWQDTVHKDIINGKAYYLPISVKVVQDQLFIWGDFTTKGYFNKGDKIIRINNQTSAQILQLLYTSLPSDGSIQTYLQHQVSNGFEWLYYLYVEQPKSFQITYQPYASQNTKTINIDALNRPQILENYKKRYASKAPIQKALEGKSDFYELTHHEQYSYLKLKTFNRNTIEKHQLKSKKFYKTVFQEINTQHKAHLIIDLRDNTGGRNEFADDIIPFISKASIDAPFLKKTISWHGKRKTYKVPRPSKQAYQGKIYVLINGNTFSAGSTIARYLKEFGNAIVIGEESGTRYEGFAAGSKQYVHLPHSKIRIAIPRYHISFPPSNKQTTSNRGLLPDYNISPSISDWIDKKDVVLDKARSIVKQP